MEATDREQSYWGTERMSYDDELDAWRERTAHPVAALVESPTGDPGHAFIGGLLGLSWRPVRTADAPSHARPLFETSHDEVLAA